MPDSEKHSKVVEIKKYQNRRYYDTTNSQHISLEKIHKLICQGYEVRVIDAKSEEDITPRILMQILLEYEPLKVDFFSPSLLSQVIRLNDLVLKDFYETYFSKALRAFVSSKDQFDRLFRQSQSLPFNHANSGKRESHNPFAAWMSMNPFASSDSSPTKKVSDLGQEMEDLKQQVTELQELLKKKTD